MNAEKLISLIEELPDSDKHIFQDVDDHGDPEWWVTNEWLVGAWAGLGFKAKTKLQSANYLIDYFNSMECSDESLGYALRNAGWPDYDSVLAYCKNRYEKDQQ